MARNNVSQGPKRGNAPVSQEIKRAAARAGIEPAPIDPSILNCGDAKTLAAYLRRAQDEVVSLHVGPEDSRPDAFAEALRLIRDMRQALESAGGAL